MSKLCHDMNNGEMLVMDNRLTLTRYHHYRHECPLSPVGGSAGTYGACAEIAQNNLNICFATTKNWF